jgi:acetylornithine/succinyldiaminopimelate/putrescine aminotransferase
MEGALKLARKWGGQAGKSEIIGLSDSFHGRTLGSLSITGREKYREGFGPFLPGTSLLKLNDTAELIKIAGATTLAVVLECIQGEGGINLLSAEYVEALNTLRARHGFLIIADEIQSGIGRTGKLFSFEHFGLKPDIVVVAKAIGGGLPLGAFMGTQKLADVFSPGAHGSTFGGNPVACAAGIATVREILEGGVMQNAAAMGDYLLGRLEQLRTSHPDLVADIRGKGLMVGLELKFDGAGIIESLLQKKILLNLTNTTVVRWLPPLNIQREQIDHAIEAVGECLREKEEIMKSSRTGELVRP